MKRYAQRVARKLWSGGYGGWGRLLVMGLAPVSALWGAVTWWRNRRADRVGGARIDRLPVVSVGNLAVGGTGKTPFASWVAGTLAEAGARPSILLRGYGADEVHLHRAWLPGIEVVAGADRVAGARRALEAGSDVAILDDGFQHRRLARDLDIVMLAVEDPFPGHLLPAGPYRERPAALGRADVVVLTRRSASVDAARGLASAAARYVRADGAVTWGCLRLAPGPLRRFIPSSDGKGGWSVDADTREPGSTRGLLASPLVMTAVARPEAVLHDVAGFSTDTAGLLAFEDHHVFSESDVRAAARRAAGRPIVVTEKDAVKLARFVDLLGDAWVLTQRLEWDWGEEDVRSRILAIRDTLPTGTVAPP